MKNRRMHLREYSAPLQYRPVNRINGSIENDVNFRVDHHTIQMLPHFHGMALFCEISYYPNILIEIVKMRLFPFTLKDKTKDWLHALAAFLKKFYLGKMNYIRRLPTHLGPRLASGREVSQEIEKEERSHERERERNKKKMKKKRNMKVIGWKMDDRRGIDMSACMHCIYLEEGARTIREPQ
ncbi:unnamed protein product [Spirodela intermedia]|uniref:Uncharacterized protein n=1 Tax=Spirodela intermedia TaxID=51605 RepID=A0A7I8LP02_SPIIN|nr:unnamed protein product [Spirodela intermedia]